MSNLLRKRRPLSTGGAEISPTKKQRLIDGAEMLLDIAMESADVFPPLKTCLGGINALIKHYRESKDVGEKLGDLIPWLTKLKDGLTTPHAQENCEEIERRERFTRSLGDIEKRSQILLDKGKMAKILDKRQDSGIVAKLVEELRQAILIYQLSQQQSIDNQVTQLASSFNAFLKLHEKAPEMKRKIESALARLDRFTAEGSAFGDKGESKRKMILFEALEGIKDEFLPLLERTSAVGYKENEADVRTVCQLAEDVRDAVIEHQFAQQTAMYEQNCRLIDYADLSVLNSCSRAQGAEYRHGNRRGCLKGTRNGIINEIGSWAKDFDKSPVYWLNGLAGTGKTTIAQTIAEQLFAEGNLGASFFCSRDFEDRSNLHFIFPTLAFQLAHKYPDFRSSFVSLLRLNPDVAHESLYSQMRMLISEPLQEIGVSTVIVIDALDECKDDSDEPSSAILSVLGRFVEEIPNVKFFITGRPEPRIQTGFRLPLLMDSTDVFVLHDVHPSLIENDIRLFLKHRLSHLAQRHQLEDWPSDEFVDLLCRRAAGLFVYAVATVKFLDSNTHLPEHRLDVLLKVPERTAPEGKTRLNSKTTLDSLYTSILQAAFSEEDPDVDSKVRTTVGTVVIVFNPLSPRAIAELIGLNSKEVMLYLTLIQSLLVIGEDFDQPVKPFHKSFPDFIVDPSRCVDPRFFISPGPLHLELAMNCLRLMNNELEQDLLSLPEYVLNSEVMDLQMRIDGRISIALQYACRSWHNHLAEARGEIADVIPYLRIFLEEKFLAWLEVLSVVGDVGSASVGLEKLMLWLQKDAKDSKLPETARDCFHFVTKFFEPISASATHIYHSALELCPISSIVRRLYYDRCHGITRVPRVVIGTPDSWDPTISFSGKDAYKFCTWSPCGRFVATQTNRTVEIRNQLTFELLAVLQPSKNTLTPTGPLSHSHNGRSLACGFDGAIVIWDIQTGGVVGEIRCPKGIVSLVWSLDGKTIATTLGSEHSIPGVRTFDIASGVQTFAEQSNWGVAYHLQPAETSFRTIRMKLSDDDYPTLNISISDIGTPCVEIELFTVMVGVKPLSLPAITFSPSTYRVSILGPGTLRVLDIRTSDCLLEERGDFTSPQFSSDGNLFAASHWHGIRVWKYTPGGYVLWGESLFRNLPFSSWDELSLEFSPTSSSILSRRGNVLQFRRLDDPPSIPKTYRQYAAISDCGSRILTAFDSESTVTIVDLHSQIPSQFIDTGVEIKGLAITGNVLLVAGAEKVVAWLLTGEGTVDGVFDYERAGYSNSIWTVPSPSWGHEFEFWCCRVGGQVGIIETDISPFIFHTTTGEVLGPAHQPQRFSRPRILFYRPCDCGEYHNLRNNSLSRYDAPPEDGWLTTHATMPETRWVTDPEGRHRFWVPFDWRGRWGPQNWHHDIMTLISNFAGQLVVVKF